MRNMLKDTFEEAKRLAHELDDAIAWATEQSHESKEQTNMQIPEELWDKLTDEQQSILDRFAEKGGGPKMKAPVLLRARPVRNGEVPVLLGDDFRRALETLGGVYGVMAYHDPDYPDRPWIVEIGGRRGRVDSDHEPLGGDFIFRVTAMSERSRGEPTMIQSRDDGRSYRDQCVRRELLDVEAEAKLLQEWGVDTADGVFRPGVGEILGRAELDLEMESMERAS